MDSQEDVIDIEDDISMDAGSGDEGLPRGAQAGSRAPGAVGNTDQDEEDEGEELDDDEVEDVAAAPLTDFELLADVTNGLGRLMEDEAGRKVFVKGEDCIGECSFLHG